MAAVAGMTMPPEERRSPASDPTSTSTRSWSILMGVLSVTSVVALPVGSGQLALEILRSVAMSTTVPTTPPTVLAMLPILGSPETGST